MKHRLLSLLLALLLLPSFASAEVIDASVLALLNAAASAAVVSEDEVLSFTEGETVPEAFASRFLLALGQAIPESAEDRAACLEAVIAAPLPTLEHMEQYTAPAYAGLEIMSYDADEDGDAVMVIGTLYTLSEEGDIQFLDVRIVAEIQKSDDSPYGWQLHRFAVGEELLMESAAAAYYAQTMAEYVHTTGGFSILFPDIFPEDSFVDEENGISAALPENGISFFVHKETNEKGLTLSALLDEQKKENPSLETNMDEMTGCAKTRFLTEEGLLETNFYLVSEEAIYHAQFVCPAEEEKNYTLYLTYMMNSFTADELGLG